MQTSGLVAQVLRSEFSQFNYFHASGVFITATNSELQTRDTSGSAVSSNKRWFIPHYWALFSILERKAAVKGEQFQQGWCED